MPTRCNAGPLMWMVLVGMPLGCKIREVPAEPSQGDPAAAQAQGQAWTAPEDLLNEAVYRDPKEQAEPAGHQHDRAAPATPEPTEHDHEAPAATEHDHGAHQGHDDHGGAQ